ncbi:hypothetical protein IVB12_15510 [Bradyrhizobium sp. 179]|uniref:hypothetical protein n=1 Tax=Bradyrhizobium sp. 179 TaxID=2782648 RepID=UPI001FFAE1B8|nr:hypothetical protein [Bradyrhizobium sp. 179]MCK1543322.1 hypothetical protein [Bradyrhizobium sp. 179]
MKPSAATQAAYNAVDQFIKDDIVEAANWARTTLTNHEGAGHHIVVTGTKDGLVVCSFAKPQWAGDHSGPAMEEGAEAIVMAVCSYLNGQ